MSSSALAAVCRRLAVHSIFVGSTSHLLLEPPGEMLRILEAKLVGYLTNGFSCVENPFFGCFQGLLLDMLQGGQACFFSQQVTQVIGRKAELVGTCLHGRQSFRGRFAGTEIVVQQGFEAGEDVTVQIFPGDELSVVETDAIVE